jgi:hypothetical protein
MTEVVKEYGEREREVRRFAIGIASRARGGCASASHDMLGVSVAVDSMGDRTSYIAVETLVNGQLSIVSYGTFFLESEHAALQDTELE